MKRRGLAVLLIVWILLRPSVAGASVGSFREGTPPRDSQLDAGYHSVGYQGEWRIRVKGHSTVAVGVGELPYQFVFSDMKSGQRMRSTLVTGAFPVCEQTQFFWRDWGSTVQTMTETLRENFGGAVTFVSFDNIYGNGGNRYIYYFELWDSGSQRSIPVTMAWRFGDSYYMFSMGVNLGDMPEMFAITKDTAEQFQDYTQAASAGFVQTIYTGSDREDLPEWPYGVVDPIWILCEYLGVEEIPVHSLALGQTE